MATGGMISSNLPVFDGKGYDDWCVKMDTILGFQEVDEIVKKGFKEPSKNDTDEVKKSYKENRRLDCKAKMLLHQCISATIFQKVSKATTTKEVWDILQEGYDNSGKVKKVRLQSLQRQYELLCMGEQETIVEYIGRIHVIVNAMRAFVAIKECKDLETMRVEELQNSLEAHEQRLTKRRNTDKGTNQALHTRVEQKIKGRGEVEDVQKLDEVEAEIQIPLKNLEMKIHGHYASECWHNETVKKSSKNDEANLAQEDACETDSDHVLLMSTMNHVEDDKCWYLDTGCSNHMTGKREWLIDLDTSINSSV
ncbi:uncharacterized protein LOC124834907 [Vigna umbellata]|uniref:uncharacterized protein LOC124834907 n=1 Tax=Vigna umbellata TaxID=87088 RepID=UPI001F5F26C3|nr:uncharacterized protein LOC124834907 [Vigna umbellata]